MKALFAVIVFMASAYLLLPENAYNKLSSLMPEKKMEEAAKSILSQVDARLENFEQSAMKVQNQSTTQLLATLSSLEKTVNEQQLAINALTIANKELSEQQKNKLSEMSNLKLVKKSEFKPQPPLAQTQVINGNNIERKTADISQQMLNKREQGATRQALLQDIVDRMNATSLLALTNN